MRCPRCRADNPADLLLCGRCRARLYAWLGDPFGNLELPGGWTEAYSTRVTGGPAVGTSQPRQSSAFPIGKLIFSLGLLWLVSQVAPLGAMLLFLLAFVVLVRWPRTAWPIFALTLTGAALMTVLLSRDGSTPTTTRSTVAPVATVNTARLTATATARNASTAYDLGRQHWLRGEHEAAVAAFSQAIELRSDRAAAFNMRALALVGAGQYDPALADANRALNLGRSAAYLDTRGYVYLKRAQHQLALADYDEAFRLNANPGAHYHLGRGLARERLGDSTSARLDLETGLRMLAQATPDPQLIDLELEARRVLGLLGQEAVAPLDRSWQ